MEVVYRSLAAPRQPDRFHKLRLSFSIGKAPLAATRRLSLNKKQAESELRRSRGWRGRLAFLFVHANYSSSVTFFEIERALISLPLLSLSSARSPRVRERERPSGPPNGLGFFWHCSLARSPSSISESASLLRPGAILILLRRETRRDFNFQPTVSGIIRLLCR